MFQQLDWHQKLRIIHEKLLLSNLVLSHHKENQNGQLKEVFFIKLIKRRSKSKPFKQLSSYWFLTIVHIRFLFTLIISLSLNLLEPILLSVTQTRLVGMIPLFSKVMFQMQKIVKKASFWFKIRDKAVIAKSGGISSISVPL